MHESEVSAGIASPRWSEAPTPGRLPFGASLSISAYSSCSFLMRSGGRAFAPRMLCTAEQGSVHVLPKQPIGRPKAMLKPVSFRGAREGCLEAGALYKERLAPAWELWRSPQRAG